MKLRPTIAAGILALSLPFIHTNISHSAEPVLSQDGKIHQGWQELLQADPDRAIEGDVRIINGDRRLSPVSFTANVHELDNGDLILRIDYAARSFDVHVENLKPNSMTYSHGLGRFDDIVGYYLPAENTLQFWGPIEERNGEMVRTTRNFQLDRSLF
ncbi:MAG: hypothetical protein AAGM36_16860 [Cyanobacteria bacterium J06597_1]